MLATLGTETVNGLRNSPNITQSCGPLKRGLCLGLIFSTCYRQLDIVRGEPFPREPKGNVAKCSVRYMCND